MVMVRSTKPTISPDSELFWTCSDKLSLSVRVIELKKTKM